MDAKMLALVNAPLADPLKLYLPKGTRPTKRAAKPVYEGEFAPKRISMKALRERQEKADAAKLASLMDYYATTTVPFERIAEHVKLPLERVTVAMKSRGRLV